MNNSSAKHLSLFENFHTVPGDPARSETLGRLNAGIRIKCPSDSLFVAVFEKHGFVEKKRI